MSNKKNRKTSSTGKTRNICVDTKRSQQPSMAPQKGDVDIEDVFRGFEKIPKVVIEPVDVNHYLNKYNLNLKMNFFRKRNGFGVHYDKLNKKCFVRIKREDLSELKRMYKYGKHISSFSSSESFKCKICEKVYPNQKKLLNHVDNKHKIVTIPDKKVQKRVSFSDHVIIHEVKEYHSCRKCTKIFENYKSLKTHMKLKHKKRKCYICHYCSKDFVDRMFFKVHIKLHCDCCGLLFPTRKLHLEHKRTVCKQLKRYKCKTCQECYFNFMDLKDHSYDHLGTFFICDICKDQFENKCQVSHHITFSHTKLHPTSLHTAIDFGADKQYHCNFCNETSLDMLTIEHHTGELPDLRDRITTGYKDHNFCDQCLTRFNTEKEMLQHKLTHFDKSEKKQEAEEKTIFKLNDIPENFLKVQVTLEKLKMPMPNNENGKPNKESELDEILEAPGKLDKKLISEVGNENSISNDCNEKITAEDSNGTESGGKQKAKPRKVLFSNHQCQNCLKYFSTAYCLRRHIKTVHSDYDDLQCKVCEEVFVWPSLLLNHKCIRLQHPEMPFDDARPEIQIENLYDMQQSAFDNLPIPDDDMSDLDFEIPAPIVNMIEAETPYVPPGILTPQNFNTNNVYITNNQNSPYTLVMQEVPIEF